MVDRTRASISISAPCGEVMAVIADFPAYPQWAGGVKSAEVLEAAPDGRARRVRFRVDAGPIKDTYVLAYEWDGDEKVSWQLLEGQMQRSQQGSYLLEESDGATEVTYELAVELSVPLPGILKR